MDGPILYLASDYAGHHRGTGFSAISIVCCDFERSSEWWRIQSGFRSQFLPDGRRMSFKAVTDQRRAMALLPFLRGADEISGALVTLLVDRRLRQIAGGRQGATHPRFSQHFAGNWSGPLFEQMSRVVHLVGLLIGGFAKPGQNIFWISDEDALFATPGREQDIATFLGALTSHYVPFELGELGVATTRIDPGDRVEEDLAAIADLAAGALVDGMTRFRASVGRDPPLGVAVPFEHEFPERTRMIWDWLFETGKPLSRVTLVAQRTPDGFAVSRFQSTA